MKRIFSQNMTVFLLGFLLLLFIVFTMYLVGQVKIMGNLNASILVIVVDTILVLIAIPIFRIWINYMKGDLGELDVKIVLDRLKGYRQVPDVVINEKDNIDNVIVGQNGVWTLESKYQVEKIIIHDKFLDDKINQAFSESRSVQDFLRQNGIFIPVTPILVFANKKSVLSFGEHPVRGVFVIGVTWLKKLLTDKTSGNLTLAQCDQIVKLLKSKSSLIN